MVLPRYDGMRRNSGEEKVLKIALLPIDAFPKRIVCWWDSLSYIVLLNFRQRRCRICFYEKWNWKEKS